MINIECPICINSNQINHVKVENLQIVRCKKCGLLFYNPNISEDEHIKYVNKKDYYIGSKDIQGYPDYFERDHINGKYHLGKWFLKLIKEYHKNNPNSVLELGAASGHTLKAFIEAGWDPVLATEINQWIYSHRFEELNMFIGELWELPIEPKYDAFIACDSFEHVQFPNRLLEYLIKILNSNAILIFHIPNADALKCKTGDSNWYLWSPKQHCFFYSPKTLDMLLKKYNIYRIDKKSSSEDDEIFLIYEYRDKN